MSKIEKMAAKDAYEYGLALMFFGEGAGTRRKLIQAQVSDKVHTIPGYGDAFDKAFGNLSQMELAERAIKERKRIDAAAKAGKNIRALKSGNLGNLSTGVFVVVGGVILARQTGYDKKIEAQVKKQWYNAKAALKARTDGKRIRLVREETYQASEAASAGNIAKAKALRESGKTYQEIAERLAVSETTVRFWLDA